jgi:hypothetical protein
LSNHSQNIKKEKEKIGLNPLSQDLKNHTLGLDP